MGVLSPFGCFGELDSESFVNEKADRLLPDTDFGPGEALSISYEAEANYAVGTGYKRFVPLFARKLGPEYKNTGDFQALILCLQTGGAANVMLTGQHPTEKFTREW